MRRLEQLIAEAKLSTNTNDINSISGVLCQSYMTRIHSYLEDLLFLVNDENDLFLKDYTFNLIRGKDEYDLPIDIYAKSSIDNVAVSFLNGLSQTFLPLKKVSRKQRGFTFGYFIQEKQVVFTPKPQSPLNIKLTYQRKLPSPSLRVGKIDTIVGNIINIDPATYVSGLTDYSDFVCFVDKDGKILNTSTDLALNTTYVPIFLNEDLTGALDVSATTGAVPGAYVVSGKYASSHMQLPDECEKYLIMALERMIQYRQSSPDIKVSDLFSSEELATIKEVFADNSYDDAKPPVTEWQEWLP
jgi:hypothetical protein